MVVTQGLVARGSPKHTLPGRVRRDRLVCGDATTAVLTQCPVVRRWVGLANCTPSLEAQQGRAGWGTQLCLRECWGLAQ